MQRFWIATAAIVLLMTAGTRYISEPLPWKVVAYDDTSTHLETVIDNSLRRMNYYRYGGVAVYTGNNRHQIAWVDHVNHQFTLLCISEFDGSEKQCVDTPHSPASLHGYSHNLTGGVLLWPLIWSANGDHIFFAQENALWRFSLAQQTFTHIENVQPHHEVTQVGNGIYVTQYSESTTSRAFYRWNPQTDALDAMVELPPLVEDHHRGIIYAVSPTGRYLAYQHYERPHFTLFGTGPITIVDLQSGAASELEVLASDNLSIMRYSVIQWTPNEEALVLSESDAWGNSINKHPVYTDITSGAMTAILNPPYAQAHTDYDSAAPRLIRGGVTPDARYYVTLFHVRGQDEAMVYAHRIPPDDEPPFYAGQTVAGDPLICGPFLFDLKIRDDAGLHHYSPGFNIECG